MRCRGQPLRAGETEVQYRPLDEGDYVQVAGLGGTLEHVSIMSTTVMTTMLRETPAA